MKRGWRFLVLAGVLIGLGVSGYLWWFAPLLEFAKVNSEVIQGVEAGLAVVALVIGGILGWLGWKNKEAPATQEPGRQTNTSGGANVEGDVNTGGGDFINGDKVNHTPIHQPENSPVVTGNGSTVHVYYQNYLNVDGAPTLSEDGFQQFLDNYLTWVMNFYNRARLFGLERLGINENRPRQALTDVFIPISLCRITPPRQEEVEERLEQVADGEGLERIKAFLSLVQERQKEASKVDLSKLLVTAPRLAVIGGPGCGKSTLIDYLAVCLAQYIKDGARIPFQLPQGRPAPVPLIIPLRGYREYRRLCLEAKRSLDEPQAGKLAGYILYTLNHYGEVGGFRRDGFERLLRSGNCLILLDGLDEVVDPKERGRVREEVERLADGYPGNLFLVTAREAGYQDTAIFNKPFVRLDVLPLDDDQIDHLVKNWCLQLYQGEEKTKTAEITTAIAEINARRSDSELPPLVSSPLMVTMVVGVRWSRTHLPRGRAKLYDAAVEVILQLQYTLDDQAREQLSEWGGTLDEQREWMWTLAYEMQRGGKAGAAISVERVGQILSHALKGDAFDRFIQAVHERGGLFEERAGLYQFTHLTFQEFLAACYIVDRRLGEKALSPLVRDPWWREVLLLTYGYASFRARDYSRGYLAWLSDLPGETRLDGLELAAAAILDIEKPNPELRRKQAEKLAGVLTDPELKFTPPARARAGDTLGKLGDPRFRADFFFLPDEALLGFVEIPGGPFVMGSDPDIDKEAMEREYPQHEVSLPTYYLARYPVTVAQFRAYVNASGNPPGDPDSLRGVDNHPVVWVTWHEALAYCGWLADALREDPRTPARLREILQSGGRVTLPSEAEWEKAARGVDGRIYPWGNAFDPDLANTSESGIGGTSAVGCFPGGASPRGLLDMSGNVWEWTRSLWGKDISKPDWEYPYDPREAKREDLRAGDDVRRVQRGGSFSNEARCARCAWRFPRYGNDDSGFRVAVLPSSTLNSDSSGTL